MLSIVHSCVHCDIRFGGANLVLLHVSVAVCLLLGSGCCGFCVAQRMQLQGRTTGTPASERYTDIRIRSTDSYQAESEHEERCSNIDTDPDGLEGSESYHSEGSGIATADALRRCT